MSAEIEPRHPNDSTPTAIAHESAESATPDARTASEHDCDRILYSDELRRLGGVTQVVAVGEMPLFHTRLTHTLKVQQLSRRMAEHLSRQNDALALSAVGGLDIGAAEAAGLAHDLGHPPFGHVGEETLREECEETGTLDGYEGNAQTFRILTKLSRRGADTEFGLELSAKTLAGVIKYPWLRAGQREASSKWNAYPTESAKFDEVRAELGLHGESRSIEACIMDWADDITYAVHDLEDFIRSGRVPIVALATDEVERAEFVARAVERLEKKHQDIDWAQVTQNFGDVVSTMFAQFQKHEGTGDDLAKLRSVSRKLIDNYVSAIALSPGPEPLSVPPEVRGEVELFKQLTWHYVIHDPALATLQTGQKRLVKDLFGDLVQWLSEAETGKTEFRLPKRLWDMYLRTAVEPGHEYYSGKIARQRRSVADYIASLTETQAIDLHGRLRGSGAHSVTDPWLRY